MSVDRVGVKTVSNGYIVYVAYGEDLGDDVFVYESAEELFFWLLNFLGGKNPQERAVVVDYLMATHGKLRGE